MSEFHHQNLHLYRRDCMDLMADFHDEYFDLAVVDPPYGIGPTWSKSRKDRFYQGGKLHAYQNVSAPDARYFSELIRVSKHQIIWGGNYFTDHLPPTNSWIVWDKGRDASKSFMSEGELAWTSFSGVLRIIPLVWDGARKCEKVIKIHPHQKPIRLYQSLYKTYLKPGYKVLDTHLGSASSAVAALGVQCDFYGCELEDVYFSNLVERIELCSRQGDFFDFEVGKTECLF